MHLKVFFLKSRYRMGDICLGCQNFKKWGMLEIPDILRGEW